MRLETLRGTLCKDGTLEILTGLRGTEEGRVESLRVHSDKVIEGTGGINSNIELGPGFKGTGGRDERNET